MGSSGDDGYVRSLPSIQTTQVTTYVGLATYIYHSWSLWTGITIPQSSVVDVATYSLMEAGTVGAPSTVVFFSDTATPTNPTSYADYNSKAVTTASVQWNGDPGNTGTFYALDVQPIVQELVSSYDYATGSMMVLHKDNGSGAGVYRYTYTWDYSGNLSGAKLHVEYTTAGGYAFSQAVIIGG